MNIDINEDDIHVLKEAGYTEDEINDFLNDFKKKDIHNNEECKCRTSCKNKFNLSKLPNLSNFKLNKSITAGFYNIVTNNKLLRFTTPKLYLPFGIDKYYKDFSVKFEIINSRCDGYTEFIEYLNNIENKIIDFLKIDISKINSQIYQNDTVTYFYGKIQSKKNMCNIIDKRSKPHTQINIFRCPKDINVKASLKIDTLWIENDIYYYKFIVEELFIV